MCELQVIAFTLSLQLLLLTCLCLCVCVFVYCTCIGIVDGALGLSLVERAHLASANRHALRLYSRERCHLPSRLVAALYDGLRHLHYFGTWCASGELLLA